MSTRYPRPGRALVPMTLRELFLRSKVPFLTKDGKQEVFAHLDRGCWDRYRFDDLDKLAKMVVQRLQGRLSMIPEKLKKRPLPPPPVGLILDDLALEPRTMNALTKCGYRERIEDLELLTLGDLLEIPAFGARCLVDLLTVLEGFAPLGWEPEGIPPLPEPKEPEPAPVEEPEPAAPAREPEPREATGLPEVDGASPFERLAKGLCALGGAVHIEDFLAKLAGRLGVPVTLERTRKNLEELAGFEWLDDEKTWFWLPSSVSARGGLMQFLSELLPETSERSLDALYAMLKDVPELRGAMPPPDVFRELCRRLPAVPVKKARARRTRAGSGRKRGPRRKVLLESGTLPDGRHRLLMRLSPSMIKNGIFSLPTALSKEVEGRFVLFAENGRQAGNLALQRPTSWGLRPFLRMRGAKEGDLLELLIDAATKHAEARLTPQEESGTAGEPPAAPADAGGAALAGAGDPD